MELIETPILNIRYGIDCRPFQLKGRPNVSFFILDNVDTQFEARLSVDDFICVQNGRYISNKPISLERWKEIFPEITSTTLIEANVFDGHYAGKRIDVPMDVKNRVQTLTNEQIRVILQGAKIANLTVSYDVCRFSAASGQVSAEYVPPLLETCANILLKQRPAAFHIIRFINKLFEETGRKERRELDCKQLLLYILEAPDQRSLEMDVFPTYVKRSLYGGSDYVMVDLSRYQVIVCAKTLSQPVVQNFSTPAALFLYLNDQNFVENCSQDEADQISSLIARFLSDLRASMALNANEWADQEFIDYENRRVWFRRENGVDERHVGVDFWTSPTSKEASNQLPPPISEDTAEEKVNINQIVREAIPSQRAVEAVYEAPIETEVVVKEEYPSYYPLSFIEAHTPSDMRRSLQRCYLLEAERLDLNRAQRRYWFSLIELIRPAALRKSLDRDLFVGLHQLALRTSQGKTLEDIQNSLFVFLVEANLITEGPLISSSRLTSQGVKFCESLGLTKSREKSLLVKHILDTNCLVALDDDLSMGWPDCRQPWLLGYRIDLMAEGWVAKTNSGRFVLLADEKQELEKALERYVFSSRVHQIQGNAVYIGANGIQIPMGLWNEPVPDPRDIIDVQHKRPTRKHSHVHVRSTEFPVEISQIDITNDAGNLGGQLLQQALYDLHESTGIPLSLLTFHRTLGAYISRDADGFQVSMWTDKTMTKALCGGLAYAWMHLFLEYMTSSGPVALWEPYTVDERLHRLSQDIVLKTQREELPEAFWSFIDSLYHSKPARLVSWDENLLEISDEVITESRSDCRNESEVVWFERLSRARMKWKRYQESHEVCVLSNFARDAFNLGTDYGTKELLCRAFEAYVEDCCQQVGIDNELLVFAANVNDRLGKRMYPIGRERWRFDTAFDTFFEELEMSPDRS